MYSSAFSVLNAESFPELLLITQISSASSIFQTFTAGVAELMVQLAITVCVIIYLNLHFTFTYFLILLYTCNLCVMDIIAMGTGVCSMGTLCCAPAKLNSLHVLSPW